jgi:glutathione synthase/RimK-type ligase-like ATP-grasp enzyme
MKKLDLNCGSIDLIKGCDGKYYFLEVNPTGQFGMIDFPCNYGLHRKVAEKLIEFDKQ